MNDIKPINNSANQRQWYYKLHSKLLPQDSEVGIMPYIWLCYLLMFFAPFFFVDFNFKQYLLSALLLPVFFYLYFKAFWVNDKKLVYYIAAIWVIGFVLSLNNMPTASVFTIYSAAFTANYKHSKTAFITLAAIIISNTLLSIVFQVSPYIYLPGSFFGLIIGASNIFLSEMSRKNKLIKASQEEIKLIASSAERERIARDLHDLIGHTFSAINIKAQLATKLINHDADKAIQEIKEIEKISRNSLSQVREVVSDYRQRDLATEISQARILLDSLDIKVNEQVMPVESLLLSTEQNTSLAFIVSELTTNIMRHGRSTECDLKLELLNQHVTLNIKNDGEFNDFSEGSGLKGIRERIEQLGGHVEFNTNSGFLASITFPTHN